MGLTAPAQPASPSANDAGLAARRIAAGAVAATLATRQPLDETLAAALREAALSDRDAGLARAIAVTTFRHFGTITRALEARLKAGLGSLPRSVQAMLATASAQILFLDVPDHAAVDLAVEQTRAEPKGERLAGVVNAVLRRIAVEAATLRADVDPLAHDMPDWLVANWRAANGEPTARAIANALTQEGALDLTVKSDPEGWAARLEGHVLPTGSVRLSGRTPVQDLPGYAEGAWWVQDAAAAVPARLLGDVAGLRVLDLCAAPGGKTAQLAAAGAVVTAVDRSAPRLAVLERNLARLGLSATVVVADAAAFADAPYDAVLLDAPCTATGTIRRHPDIAWTKTPLDQMKLAALQQRLLTHALTLLKPGGTLVYCTCSLQPDEGEAQVAALLQRHAGLARRPILASEVSVADAITPTGDFRALPHQLPGDTPRLSGWGGFYAARLIRLAA